MAQQMNLNSITSKNFVTYTEDLLNYTLGCLGIDWEPKRSLNFRSAKRRRTVDFVEESPQITPEYGDAVLKIRSIQDDAFSKHLSTFNKSVFETPSSITDFIYSRSKEYFHFPDFQHAFFLYSAFLVDLALRCFESGRGDLVETIVNCMDYVYETHLKLEFKNFNVINSWNEA